MYGRGLGEFWEVMQLGAGDRLSRCEVHEQHSDEHRRLVEVLLVEVFKRSVAFVRESLLARTFNESIPARHRVRESVKKRSGVVCSAVSLEPIHQVPVGLDRIWPLPDSTLTQILQRQDLARAGLGFVERCSYCGNHGSGPGPAASTR